MVSFLVNFNLDNNLVILRSSFLENHCYPRQQIKISTRPKTLADYRQLKPNRFHPPPILAQLVQKVWWNNATQVRLHARNCGVIPRNGEGVSENIRPHMGVSPYDSSWTDNKLQIFRYGVGPIRHVLATGSSNILQRAAVHETS